MGEHRVRVPDRVSLFREGGNFYQEQINSPLETHQFKFTEMISINYYLNNVCNFCSAKTGEENDELDGLCISVEPTIVEMSDEDVCAFITDVTSQDAHPIADSCAIFDLSALIKNNKSPSEIRRGLVDLGTYCPYVALLVSDWYSNQTEEKED